VKLKIKFMPDKPEKIKIKRAKPFAANRETIKRLEEMGWTAFVVEQVIPHTFLKRDVFGFGDILAMSPSRGIMLVQATGGGNGSTRAIKIRQEPRHAIWLASGGRIQVWDFVKRANQKERECRITEITKL
jgi:hypothetical protein